MHRVLQDPSIAPYEPIVGRGALRAAIAAEFDRVRARSPFPPYELLIARIGERIEAAAALILRPVVNATGVLLHTNLGRAPLAISVYSDAAAVAAGYSNLEYDLIAGERGSRYDHASALLCELTGAQDALIVNNCAAAVLLLLDTFARGLEVIVSRNQLLEIGGGFRLPEILARSGAILIEVGTANRVRLADFATALSPRTALLMRTHPSNYRIEGFTQDVSGGELVAFGRVAGVAVIEDLGSGALVDLSEYGLPRERTVQDAIKEGIALVAFSGDKLLGGPQAGIIAGSRTHVARLRSNPLLRALRVDKITLELLAGTLRLYRSPEMRMQIPFYRMLAATREELLVRAGRYASAIGSAQIVESTAHVGAGSVPGFELASIAVACATPFADELAARLRRGIPPIVSRIEDGRVLLDMRTIGPAQDEPTIAALRAIAQE